MLRYIKSNKLEVERLKFGVKEVFKELTIDKTVYELYLYSVRGFDTPPLKLLGREIARGIDDSIEERVLETTFASNGENITMDIGGRHTIILTRKEVKYNNKVIYRFAVVDQSHLQIEDVVAHSYTVVEKGVQQQGKLSVESFSTFIR